MRLWYHHYPIEDFKQGITSKQLLLSFLIQGQETFKLGCYRCFHDKNSFSQGWNTLQKKLISNLITNSLAKIKFFYFLFRSFEIESSPFCTIIYIRR